MKAKVILFGRDVMTVSKEKFCSVLVWFAIGILLFFVSATVVATLVDLKVDYPAHIKFASRITLRGILHPMAFLKENCYPMWHVLIWVTMNLLGTSGRLAAAVVSGCCVIGVWGCAALYLSRRYSGVEKDIVRAACFCLMFVGPIWLPFFNPNLIYGQGSPNLLHNPTHLMVRVVAFPCFLWCAAIMDEVGKNAAMRLSACKFIMLSLLVFLTALSKPSFLQIFCPAMLLIGIYKLVVYRQTAIRPVLIVALSFVPALLLMGLQTWVSFYSSHTGAAGVDIAFLKVWSKYSPNVAVSLLLATLFPVVMTAWAIRMRKFATLDMLAWLMFLFGLAQKALLIENGPRMWHGNFDWGYLLGLFFVWFSAVDKFMVLLLDHGARRRLWLCITSVVLSIHVVSGGCYFWRLLICGNWR